MPEAQRSDKAALPNRMFTFDEYKMSADASKKVFLEDTEARNTSKTFVSTSFHTPNWTLHSNTLTKYFLILRLT